MKFAYLIEPPFNFKTDVGVVTGCDVELAKVVLSAFGVESFEPVETEFANLLPGVAANKWKMTTGLFATDERKQMAAFSNPIWALQDGLLVQAGNPKEISGYTSIAENTDCILGVIRDQIQHRTAIEKGIPDSRIRLYETYTDAADAVRVGKTDAYASVGMAHSGFLEQNNMAIMEVVTVSATEKRPAYGCFGFNLSDIEMVASVNETLENYLGTEEHREMMSAFGFSQEQVDLVVKPKTT